MPTKEQRTYYRNRAAELRRLGESARDPDIRQAYEEMASSYDKLVEEADRIAAIRVRVRDASRLDVEPEAKS